MEMQQKCQSHLWLLTGTGEGRVYAESLLKEGWKITVSVVSERASIPYQRLSLENVLVGPLSSENEIRNIILKARESGNGFDCVIDLTHPFAIQITPTISKVCEELDQPFIRYERLKEKTSKAFLIKRLSDLSSYDLQNKSILFALGIRKLEEAILIAKASGAKVYARILANPESLKKALSSPILENNFALLNPSVVGDDAIEKALIRKWNIDGVVCRQSGGLTEISWQRICSTLAIKLWLLERPPVLNPSQTINTYKKLKKRLGLLISSKKKNNYE